MSSLFYRNRQTGHLEEEHVYGGALLRFLYRSALTRSLAHAIAYSPWISKVYGWWQRTAWSQQKILPFIKRYDVNTDEFAQDPQTFSSFDAFFTRKLHKEARLIAPEDHVAIIPADGRYRFFPVIEEGTLFGVKGSVFNLLNLTQSERYAKQYAQGSMILARLAPCDYHRFHFPCRCCPQEALPIHGTLYSVSPLALRHRVSILWQNKRVITSLHTALFGEVLYIEVGATNVGTIHQTYTPGSMYDKGDEKGYFSFGGSTLILLFEKGKLKLDADLIAASQNDEEILCLMGQSMGHSEN